MAEAAVLRLRIPVRDGAHMGADVALPPGEGPFPTVVMRTPYGRHRVFGPPWAGLVDRGYAVVGVDARGRGESEGVFAPICDDAEDGYDVIQWLAEQPWSTGRIGMIGGSHDGLLQWFSARLAPPALQCIVPIACSITQTSDRPFPFMNGIAQPYFMWWCHFIAGPTIQNFLAPSWGDAMAEPPLRSLDQRVGRERSMMRAYLDGRMSYTSPQATLTREELDGIDIPILIILGWWDDQITTLRTWRAIQGTTAGRRARLEVGAWDHGSNHGLRPVLGGYDVSGGLDDTLARMGRFFDRWLTDEPNGLEDEPPVRMVRTGEMRWEELTEWPPSSTVPVTLSLAGEGRLAEGEPVEGSATTDFAFDPVDPVRAAVPQATFIFSDPPLNTRYMERRPDVLVFTTEPFDQSRVFSGEVLLEAHVSSDRPDTDLVAWLTDVHPDGRSIIMGMVQGMRLRYREHDGVSRLLNPGEVVLARLTLCNLHHTVLPGHRLRVVITSSYWPWFSLNFGSEEDPVDATVAHVQHNRVHHCSEHPSRIVLQELVAG